MANLKVTAYIGGVLGLALLAVLFIRSDFTAMLQTLDVAGWKLLWLAPYRLLYFFLYAAGWFSILRPYDTDRRAGFGYVLWVTTVREAVDRLLPVASIGGGVVGVRLMRWRELSGIAVSASIMVEILLTLIALYLFCAMGLILLIGFRAAGAQYRYLLPVLSFGLLIPVLTTLLLRYGSVFQRLEGFLRPLVGVKAMSEGAVSLDRELRACLRRGWSLVFAGGLQLFALILGSLEIWFALRLFGHPIGITSAFILESMVQAMRHLAFVVPAGLGVQEAGLVVFGHALGVSSELALAVSLAKRIREVLCGLPPLLSWQWLEGRRLQRPASNAS